MNTKNNKQPNKKTGKKKFLTFLPYILIAALIIGGITIFAGAQNKEKLEYYEFDVMVDNIDLYLRLPKESS